MSPDDQERMFMWLKQQHKWSDAFASGYVHGIVIEREGKPLPHEVVGPREYQQGAMLAFAVRRGEDVESERWFRELAP